MLSGFWDQGICLCVVSLGPLATRNRTDGSAPGLVSTDERVSLGRVRVAIADPELRLRPRPVLGALPPAFPRASWWRGALPGIYVGTSDAGDEGQSRRLQTGPCSLLETSSDRRFSDL